jgi:hypothetical protein
MTCWIVRGYVAPRNHFGARARGRRTRAPKKKSFHPAGGESGRIQMKRNWRRVNPVNDRTGATHRTTPIDKIRFASGKVEKALCYITGAAPPRP